MLGSGERFRAIAENIPGVLYAFESHPNAPRALVYAGPGLADLIGEKAAADVKSNVDHFFDLIHPDDRSALERSGDLDPTSDRPMDQEYRLRTATGEYRWVRSIARGTRRDDGSTTTSPTTRRTGGTIFRS